MFSKVAVVGFGLIGGSVALALRERAPGCQIVAIDRASVLSEALGAHAADSGAEDLGLADGADLILLAAPVRQTIGVLHELPSRVRGHALITDVGSTKRAIVAAAAHLPPRLRFVGGHPLAGAATGGFQSARADLFRGRPWIFTPTSGQQDADVERLTAFVSQFGAVPRAMDAAAHDRLMAYISHLPQLAVSTLMQVVGEHAGRDGLRLAGTGLRDTTRLASSPASTWRDVTATNVDAVGAAIDDLTLALQRLKSDLTDGLELERVFDRAASWKRVLDDAKAGGQDES
jgi:prephenate dehydrogenase